MADVALPGYDQYSKWLGEGPGGYAMASDQMDLAKLFADQSLRQQEQKTLSDVMRNQQDEQMNPLLVEQQQLNNTGKGFSNTTAGVNSRNTAALEQPSLEVMRKELANKATQAELDGMYSHAQKMMASKNPEEVVEGTRIMDTHKDFIKLRKQGENAANVAGIKADSAETLAHLRGSYGVQMANARKTASGSGKAPPSYTSMLTKAKVGERLGIVKGILDTDQDPDTGTPLSPAARSFYESMYNQDVATTNARTAAQGQGITLGIDDEGKTKIKNKQPPTVATPPKSSEGVTKSGIKFKVISN